MWMHGCGGDGSGGSSQFLGFAQFAYTNNMIVLSPSSRDKCFSALNTWNDPEWMHTKFGAQPKAIKNMIDRLIEAKDPSAFPNLQDLPNDEKRDNTIRGYEGTWLD